MDTVRHLPHPDQADPHGDEPEYVEAERYVLGAGMHDPRCIPALRTIITGPDFTQPRNEIIWNTIGALYDRGEPTSPIAVRIALEKSKDLTRVGGTGYVTHLADHVGGGEPAYYAGEIRKQSDLRTEAKLGREIVNHSTQPDAEPGQIVTFIDDYLKRQKERAAGRSGDPVDRLLAELLDASSLDDMPALEPLVGDLLHLDSLARIIGPSGHMKSFVTIDIAGHVGTGMNWHGHQVKQGTVVYLVAEGARGIRKRVRAWEKHYGLRMDNVLFLPRPVQVRGDEWDTWIEAMRRLEPALIVIDTQARVSVGVEENSNTELGVVIDRIEDLRRATAACVLVVHHTGHIGEHGRGASTAKGALQSELHVSKKGDNARNMIVTMKVGKQKDDEEGADLQFGLKVIDIDGEAKADGSPVTSVVLESLDMRPRAIEQGTPEWIVGVLDKGGIPSGWGVPRVSQWLAGEGIPVTKRTVEEAVRTRKARPAETGMGNNIPDTQTWTEASLPDEPGQSLSDYSRTDLPKNLPAPLPTPTSPLPVGRSGEFDQNPSSHIPQNGGEVTGSVLSEPSSPSPIPRDGEVRVSTTPDSPKCTICHTPLHGYRAERGYDTCLPCDPTTGTHPTNTADPTRSAT